MKRKSFLAVSLLLVIVIGLFAFIYIQDTTAISARNLTINDAQNRLIDANNRISSLESQLTSALNLVLNLQGEIAEFEKIIHLSKSSVKASEGAILQNAGQRTEVTSFYGDFAGFVVVTGTSNTSTGYLMLSNSFQGYPYNQTRYTFGTAATVMIPVLPGDITVFFGNENRAGSAAATLTVTYFY